jgi:hypothetical protein
MRSSREVIERMSMTANAKVEKNLGPIPASSDTVSAGAADEAVYNKRLKKI